MRTMKGWVSALLVLALAACGSGIRVDNDYDPARSFVEFRTYAPHEKSQTVPPDAYVSELVVDRIDRAINDGLRLKGLTRVEDKSQADLLLRTHFVVEDKIDVQTWNTSYGYYHYPWGWRGGYETTVTQYKQGTLIVDLLEAKTGKLVWRGSAESRLRRHNTPEEREARIREVVTALLAKYPAR